MTAVERVVFDCNVLFQALVSPGGPARKLVELAGEGTLALYSSSYVLDELKDVVSRPKIQKQFVLSDVAVTKFFDLIAVCATMLDDVVHVYDLPRDPKDAHYVDLAVAAKAKLIVSRDKDLLALRDDTTAEGRDFHARFPEIQVLTPPELLALIIESRNIA